MAPMRLVLLACCLGGLASCDSERFLSDKWVLAAPLDEGGLDTRFLGCTGDEATCRRWIELNLGHFGEDVVGTLVFFDDRLRVRDTRTCTDETFGCSCRYVSGTYADGTASLSVDGGTCAPEPEKRLELHVTLRVEDDTLVWVEAPEVEGEPVRLERGPRGPTPSDKVCVPCSASP